MLRKRGEGTTVSYEFLIGIFITIFILIPISIFAYNMINERNKMLESFEVLIEHIQNLKEGEVKVQVMFLSEDYRIVSYEKDQEYLTPPQKDLNIPSLCEEKNNCLCVCSHSAILRDECIKCYEIEGYEFDFFPTGLQIKGKPNNALTLTYQRYGGLLGICETRFEAKAIGEEVQGCFDDNFNTAEQEFQLFISNLEKCFGTQNDNCLCDFKIPELDKKVTANMPDYYIKLQNGVISLMYSPPYETIGSTLLFPTETKLKETSKFEGSVIFGNTPLNLEINEKIINFTINGDFAYTINSEGGIGLVISKIKDKLLKKEGILYFLNNDFSNGDIKDCSMQGLE